MSLSVYLLVIALHVLLRIIASDYLFWHLQTFHGHFESSDLTLVLSAFCLVPYTIG